ncbi:uncharacterized protein EI90DRAFT_3251199 [Cantharellus anzutake]|uniref:uncharacterized protein n=1 Tax=Cantharellus anzutake TaxID=1750568 RepID=UPI001905A0A1|nr:uncharacterized protein EI90DRAFT_3251199 [Cantharellus anzutake]KAF8337958.1 hypothetical protein EI90DRAFT_3251199 [Cantharellus anzutake]
MPCKRPTDNGGIALNSTEAVFEEQFYEATEDDVEVMLEEVYEHLGSGTLPDGLADMNGGLQLGWIGAEEADAESMGEITVGSEVDSVHDTWTLDRQGLRYALQISKKCRPGGWNRWKGQQFVHASRKVECTCNLFDPWLSSWNGHGPLEVQTPNLLSIAVGVGNKAVTL